MRKRAEEKRQDDDDDDDLLPTRRDARRKMTVTTSVFTAGEKGFLTSNIEFAITAEKEFSRSEANEFSL